MDLLSTNPTNDQQQSDDQPNRDKWQPFLRLWQLVASPLNWLDRHNAAVSAFASVMVAIFTVVLAVATIDLRELSKRQTTDLERSVDVAKASAKAAQDSANAAIEANRLSRDNFVASQRPWVTVEIRPGGPLTYNINGANISVLFVLTNIGHSPATNVSINSRVFTPAPGIDKAFDIRTIQRKMIEERKTAPLDPDGYVIFPNQKVVQEITMTIGSDELKRITQVVGFISPFIIGSVDYGFEGGHHQTSFNLQISRSDRPRSVSHSKKRAPYAIFPDEGEIPIVELRLNHSPIGGDYAD